MLELVQSQAKFKDEPYAPEKRHGAISMAAGGGGGEIPSSPRNRKKPKRWRRQLLLFLCSMWGTISGRFGAVWAGDDSPGRKVTRQ